MDRIHGLQGLGNHLESASSVVFFSELLGPRASEARLIHLHDA